MATILLSAAGASLGASVGGSVLGLSMSAIGRFAGAMVGNAIDRRTVRTDQHIIGGGSETVQTGQMNRFRLTGAGEGRPIGQIFGRMRVAGQVIWSSEFEERIYTSNATQVSTQTQGAPSGGKGAAREVGSTTITNSNTTVTQSYAYSISIAVALCEGEITSIGRVWADGIEVSPVDLNMRVYEGSSDQLPDPKIEAVEGAGLAPAYRGTAYVVFENLQLANYGDRVPQFTFEVVRGATDELQGQAEDLTQAIKAVAVMPGSGEFALATTPVHYDYGLGNRKSANVNSPSYRSDMATSVKMLREELPGCAAASLIVSWFGDDLRCGSCEIRPKVEQKEFEGDRLKWGVAGLNRASAQMIAQDSGRPVYGGTPSDNSVLEAIAELKRAGQAVMFYPFILMDQIDGNGLPDPWSDASSQPKLPWRGRITCSVASLRDGSPDGTAAAASEVAAFFGAASASDFSVSSSSVSYNGPNDWGFRRFILHNAALCAAAGGVESFCVGSEMRGLTQIRGAAHSFPAVTQLIALAGEVRALLGPNCKIGYAADWSEYFGYSPQDGFGHHYFHLDPLWADENIDFIGIDNYMPLSDWRDGEQHLDAQHGSIYALEYLKSNIEGGEGYDWYYHSDEARAAQIRTPITDGAHGEPWIYRYKDLKSWWSKPHHNRISGVRDDQATAWEPQSKPFWFTEYGCAAIDKGTNQPNKFVDPKSSESSLPQYSNGQRDELMQMQYLRAMTDYWGDPARNPVSDLYGAPMLDMSRAFVWAWDARPYPHFPNRSDLWSDSANYWRGHWLNGRSTSRSLGSVVAEICLRAGETRFDVSALYGVVRGYQIADVLEARSALQPLMLRYGFDAVERDGVLHFIMRDGQSDVSLSMEDLVHHADMEGVLEVVRGSDADLAGRLRASFVQADGDFDVIVEETVLPQDGSHAVSSSDLPLMMTRAEARQMLERWLSEARLSREAVRFALPPSKMGVKAGDVVRLSGAQGDTQFRVDRVEQGASQILEAVRIEPNIYRPAPYGDEAISMRPFVPALPVLPYFLDLPLMSENEVPHAPHIAVTATPWPGAVAVYDAPTDADYGFNTYVQGRATVGVTETPLFKGAVGVIDRGAPLRVRLASDQLESIARETLLAGGNLAAIGDGSGSNWEVFQFQRAELVAPDTYELSTRLRGQFGTDGLMPDAWPIGSIFVLLNGVPNQIGLRASDRGVQRHYRIGPAARGYDDPSYEMRVEQFDGAGLRPYPPAHLRAIEDATDVKVTWLRRTRIDGDDWGWGDVPLAEEREQYVLRVLIGGIVVREEVLDAPAFTYRLADRIADGASGIYELRVAQVSERFGPGLFARQILGL
ncbi:baseplate multidomain protein megatron [Planktotalea arctica]|uniref:baseplate multidomain protein megatron n=1 Tax=Planktotalea arctica TaxID=1481893 RepID=UPI000A173FFF|nr:glycoside hydrolase/phage tail family protein [Planktotalea arctica]